MYHCPSAAPTVHRAPGGDNEDRARITSASSHSSLPQSGYGHPEVFPAISGTRVLNRTGALGAVETFSVASTIEAADAAAKAAEVQLIEIRLAMALGGKGHVTITGEAAAVNKAVDVAAESVKCKGLPADKVVIPEPRDEILRDEI